MDWFKNDDTKDSSVVELRDIHHAVRYAPLAQIEGYWNALRGNRLMPQRAEIDPRGLKGALEYCFVLERIAPGLARLRVAGSHLGDLMGMEVRGMPISAFLTAESREPFGKALEEVFETPATATLTLSAETGFGRPPLAARMLVLPVRSDLGDVSRVLGGFVTNGDLGRVPRRFTLERAEVTPILGTDSTLRLGRPPLARDPFREPDAPASQPAPGMSEGASRFAEAIPGVPYLRVVK